MGLVETTGDEEVTAETMVIGLLKERLKEGLRGRERRREGLRGRRLGGNLGFTRIEERRERMLVVEAIVVDRSSQDDV